MRFVRFLLVYYFSVKMCSAMVFDRPLPICKIHPKEIWRLSRETPVIASRAAEPQMSTEGHSSGGRALQVPEMKFRAFSTLSCQAGTCCFIPSVFDGHYSIS